MIRTFRYWIVNTNCTYYKLRIINIYKCFNNISRILKLVYYFLISWEYFLEMSNYIIPRVSYKWIFLENTSIILKNININ